MSAGHTIDLYRHYVSLEDPYVAARSRMKELQVEPFKKPVYVGNEAIQKQPDEGFAIVPSTTTFLHEAQQPYKIVDFGVWKRASKKERNLPREDNQASTTIPGGTKSFTRIQEKPRSALDTFWKWEDYLYNIQVLRARESDGRNPDVPYCVFWTGELVLEWLHEIGMDRYKETFRKNRIDGHRLSILTINRLIKMGIHDFKDLKILSQHIKKAIDAAPEALPNTRDTALPSLDKRQLYLTYKNVKGKSSRKVCLKEYERAISGRVLDYPERTLRYPMMLIQQRFDKPINKVLR